MADLVQLLSWGQDESELVTKLQAGSEAAFEWLTTYYHAPVYNVVYGILADVSESADVTQEIFLKAFRGIGRFRRGSSLKTWLFRIAVREALNQRRWWRRHHRRQVSIDADDSTGQQVVELKDLEATPFEQLASRELQTIVRSALAAVPATFRSAVILRDLEGLSYDEVAEVLEVSVGTVKSRILRGRRALRETLEPILKPAPHNALERGENGELRMRHPASEVQDAGARYFHPVATSSAGGAALEGFSLVRKCGAPRPVSSAAVEVSNEVR